MPPAVDPAEPPIKLANISSTGRAAGQTEKFSVVKPVVVAIETAWNKPLINVWLADPYLHNENDDLYVLDHLHLQTYVLDLLLFF